MSATTHPAELRVRNRTPDAVRLQLHCSGRLAWEVWIPASGEIRAPAFPPPRLEFEARITTRENQVTYTTLLADLPACASLNAQLERRSGAWLFALAPGAPVAPDTLRIANATAQSLEFGLRFPRSPYAMTGAADPGGRLDLRWRALQLGVVRGGVSSTQALSSGAGLWSIAAAGQGCDFVDDAA